MRFVACVAPGPAGGAGRCCCAARSGASPARSGMRRSPCSPRFRATAAAQLGGSTSSSGRSGERPRPAVGQQDLRGCAALEASCGEDVIVVPRQRLDRWSTSRASSAWRRRTPPPCGRSTAPPVATHRARASARAVLGRRVRAVRRRPPPFVTRPSAATASAASSTPASSPCGATAGVMTDWRRDFLPLMRRPPRPGRAARSTRWSRSRWRSRSRGVPMRSYVLDGRYNYPLPLRDRLRRAAAERAARGPRPRALLPQPPRPGLLDRLGVATTARSALARPAPAAGAASTRTRAAGLPAAGRPCATERAGRSALTSGERSDGLDLRRA